MNYWLCLALVNLIVSSPPLLALAGFIICCSLTCSEPLEADHCKPHPSAVLGLCLWVGRTKRRWEGRRKEGCGPLWFPRLPLWEQPSALCSPFFPNPGHTPSLCHALPGEPLLPRVTLAHRHRAEQHRRPAGVPLPWHWLSAVRGTVVGPPCAVSATWHCSGTNSGHPRCCPPREGDRLVNPTQALMWWHLPLTATPWTLTSQRPGAFFSGSLSLGFIFASPSSLSAGTSSHAVGPAQDPAQGEELTPEALPGPED